jgi:DNA invertase Pin-like site-specific DNA recombinase
MIPAVVYGVKASPDEKESVKRQHRLVLEAIEKEGDRGVVGRPFGEQNQSGYRKNRGPELEAAIRLAVANADEHGEAELWVWHSTRLGRGTGKKGGKRALGKLLYDLLEKGVTVRSLRDNEFTTNEQLFGIGSNQSSKYTVDLGAMVKDGLDDRRAEGKPLGTMGFGWNIEPELDADGKPLVVKRRLVTKRVIDPRQGPSTVQLFELIAEGKAPGTVARWLTSQGIRTKSGKGFTSRSVRQIVENEAYVGSTRNPPIVSRELFDAANAALTANPAQQRSKGGRIPRDESYFLRTVGFCVCGQPLYTTRRYFGGQRAYVCREKVVFSGAHKSAAPILASVLETHVMEHLDTFMDSVEAWIADRLAERNGERKQRERSLDNERRVLAELKTRRRQQLDGFDAIDLTDKQRKITLEVIEGTDGKIDAQAHRIAEAQAVLAEWGTTPAVDDALDFYNSLLDVIQGRVKAAHGPRELNEALAGILVGMWCEVADGLLLVEFELQAEPAKRLTLPVTEA